MPDTYTIKLENFEGPMDLLLYLIKKHKIDIYNIPISFILEKYLNHLSLLEELNISIEGEFMEMAATLMQIKLRSLLPKIVQDDGEIEDPRTELVNNLLAYKKMKETAKILSNLEEENKRYFYPSLNKTLTRDLKKGAVTYNIKEEEGKVYNLIQAIQKHILQKPQEVEEEINLEKYRVEDKISELMQLLEHNKKILFSSIAEKCKRVEIITFFLAILELLKQNKVTIYQRQEFSEIYIKKAMVN